MYKKVLGGFHSSKHLFFDHKTAVPQKTNWQHLALLTILCVLTYCNTLPYSWHLDDPPNILNNKALHLNTLTPATINQTFHAHPTAPGNLFRPVSNFSFAMNWYIGQDNPSGYHAVNIFIHCLIAIFLYLVCFLLLNSPVFTRRKTPSPHQIALLSTALWAIAPIHTQAVTYIVQRMAQLATLFSIITIFFFLLARLSKQRKKRLLFSFCCLCSALLAFGSKENSVLLPFSILLVEYIFFSQGTNFRLTIKKNRTKLLGILPLLLFFTWLLFNHYGANLFNYQSRNFTLPERLLTEPHILLYYLFQIFIPTATTLSIEHDITLSTSLFTPSNTLPAILLCIALIFVSVKYIYKYPIFSFAILFFFLNHLIESTAIPLELFFEHRNYLPALFLFFPISIVIVTQLKSISPYSFPWKKVILFTFTSIFLLQSGLATIERNKAWSNEFTLWQDAVAKAPESGRAKLNLAKEYVKLKQYDKAVQLTDMVTQDSGATKNKLIPISLNMKGSIAYAQKNSNKALSFYKEALQLRSDYTDVENKVVYLLIEKKQYNKALTVASKQYQRTQDKLFLLIKASLLLKLDSISESYATYLEARRFFPTSALITTGLGDIMSRWGHYEQATRILHFAITARQPNAIFIQATNYLRQGEERLAVNLLKQLIQATPVEVLLKDLDETRPDLTDVPFDKAAIRTLLFKLLKKDLPKPEPK